MDDPYFITIRTLLLSFLIVWLSTHYASLDLKSSDVQVGLSNYSIRVCNRHKPRHYETFRAIPILHTVCKSLPAHECARDFAHGCAAVRGARQLWVNDHVAIIPTSSTVLTLCFGYSSIFNMEWYSSLNAKVGDFSSTFIIELLMLGVLRHNFIVMHPTEDNTVGKSDSFQNREQFLMDDIRRWVRFNTDPCSAACYTQVS